MTGDHDAPRARLRDAVMGAIDSLIYTRPDGWGKVGAALDRALAFEAAWARFMVLERLYSEHPEESFEATAERLDEEYRAELDRLAGEG